MPCFRFLFSYFTMIFRDWSLLRFYLIWIYRGPPAAKKAAQPTDPGKAWLIEKGSVRMKVEGRKSVAAAGQWVFPPAYLDEREFSGDAEILSVRFRMRWPDGKDIFQHAQPVAAPAGELEELTELAVRLNDRVAAVSHERGKEIRYSKCSLSDYMAIDGLIARWIGQYADFLISRGIEPVTPGSADALVEEIRRRIEEIPKEMTLDRNALAESVAMSVSHMESRFARQFGRTPTQYWQGLRFQRARDLLRPGDKPVKQVAFALGFKTVARFSTWFRQQAGQSPSEFAGQ